MKAVGEPFPDEPEKLVPIKEAAAMLGLPYWKLRRAVKQRIVPSYTLLNSRRLVRISEVIDRINRSNAGNAS